MLLLVGILKSYDNVLRWMPQDLTDDKSTLVQVMAWCHQATSHYLNQCWPRSPTPYGVTRTQWVKTSASYWCEEVGILILYILNFFWENMNMYLHLCHFPTLKLHRLLKSSLWKIMTYLLWLVIFLTLIYMKPDSKVHGANMGPTWGRLDPGGPHVGHVKLAIWERLHYRCTSLKNRINIPVPW